MNQTLCISVYPGSETYGQRVGSGPPSKSSGPQPFYQIVIAVWPAYSGFIFYESALLAIFYVEYLQGTTYEKLHGTVNVLYVAFWAFVRRRSQREAREAMTLPNFWNS